MHLAAGLTVEAAAHKAGISPRTAHRRLAEPDFRRRVTQARAAMVERALGKLADGAAEAVDTLRKLMHKAKAESVRLAAARAMLELGNRLREAVELEQRLAALERLTPGGRP
jgi:hypothetical protein